MNRQLAKTWLVRKTYKTTQKVITKIRKEKK